MADGALRRENPPPPIRPDPVPSASSSPFLAMIEHVLAGFVFLVGAFLIVSAIGIVRFLGYRFLDVVAQIAERLIDVALDKWRNPPPA